MGWCDGSKNVFDEWVYVYNTSLKCKMLETPALMFSEEVREETNMGATHPPFGCLVQIVCLEILELICHF